MTTDREFALCPDCEEWSEVAFDDTLPPGGMWWKDSAGCPKCGATICVESECTFGRVVRELTRDRVVIEVGTCCKNCEPGRADNIDRVGRYDRTLHGTITGNRCPLCDHELALGRLRRRYIKPKIKSSTPVRAVLEVLGEWGEPHG